MTYPKNVLTILLLMLAACTAAHAQDTKKELVQKLLQLQQPGLDSMARDLASRPVMQMMPAAGNVLQTQVPPDKREAVSKSIEADMKKYVDEVTPLLRERAIKLAPSTYGVALEEKFSEDELKQLVTWFESPLNRKFQQLWPDLQNGFVQKLMTEASPLLDPKLQALQKKVRASLGLPQQAGPASSSAPASKPPAK